MIRGGRVNAKNTATRVEDRWWAKSVRKQGGNTKPDVSIGRVGGRLEQQFRSVF